MKGRGLWNSGSWATISLTKPTKALRAQMPPRYTPGAP